MTNTALDRGRRPQPTPRSTPRSTENTPNAHSDPTRSSVLPLIFKQHDFCAQYFKPGVGLESFTEYLYSKCYLFGEEPLRSLLPWCSPPETEDAAVRRRNAGEPPPPPSRERGACVLVVHAIFSLDLFFLSLYKCVHLLKLRREEREPRRWRSLPSGQRLFPSQCTIANMMECGR